jgi:hypothetical protein
VFKIFVECEWIIFVGRNERLGGVIFTFIDRYIMQKKGGVSSCESSIAFSDEKII